MENISAHVSYSEGIVSATGTRRGIDNTPSPEILKVMKGTATGLFEPIRNGIGKPVRIISFYRCPALNKAVGGAKSSQHMTGEAMDLQATSGMSNADLFRYIVAHVKFDQIIWEFGTDNEPAWVHVSLAANGKNRRSIIRAKKVGTKTVYEPFKP
jgi:zinc D-Ala-D-Ala carboxypeptidase